MISTLRGFMWKRSVKGGRISSKQRRYIVLHEAFLHYYKKERDTAAAGVIPLDYYVVTRKIQPKKNLKLKIQLKKSSRKVGFHKMFH